MEEKFSPIIDKKKKQKTEVQPERTVQVQSAPKPPKRKFGLKIFTFLGGLLDIGIGLLVFAEIIMMFTNYTNSITSSIEGLLNFFFWPFVICFFFVMAVGAVLFLVFGFITTISSFKSDRKNLNGLVVTSLVFDFLILIFGGILLGTGGAEDASTLFYITFAAIVFAIIFKIIDLALIRHREKTYYKRKDEYLKQMGQGPEAQGGIDFSKLSESSENEGGNNK